MIFGSSRDMQERSAKSIVVSFRRYFLLLKALLFREGDLRKQNALESIMSLLEPIFFIALLSLLFAFAGRRQDSPLGGSPVLFLSTGFFPLYLFMYVSRRLRIPPMGRRRFAVEQRLDHILIHVVLRILDYTLLGFLLFGFLYFFFTDQAMPSDVAPILASCGAIVALGFGWVTVNLTIGKMFKRGSRLWPLAFGMVSRSLIFFSGVFYVPDLLPPDIRYFIAFNPLTHAIQLFRMGFYPQYPTFIFDANYLMISSVVAILLGLMMERITRRYETSND
jgi:capsular polysaccharide transport system permease protein